jgi:hypothetical protein
VFLPSDQNKAQRQSSTTRPFPINNTYSINTKTSKFIMAATTIDTAAEPIEQPIDETPLSPISARKNSLQHG